MSDLKMTCPSCGARTSDIGWAARNLDPCPYCGRVLPEVSAVSDPTPLVTASRDALAEGLRTAGVEVGSVGGQAFREHVADALLASGVVRAVDGLAEDEALVGGLVQQIDHTVYDETFEDVRAILRALAAALGTPTCPDCGHQWSPDGCTGDPTPSDVWAGVAPAACDCPCPTPTDPSEA